jgi:allantoicase
MLEYTFAPGATPDELMGGEWRQLVPDQNLQPHSRHRWAMREVARATHVRLNIYPDGGVARLRVIGRVAAAG